MRRDRELPPKTTSRRARGRAFALVAVAFLGACATDERATDPTTTPGAATLEKLPPQSLMRLAERFHAAGDENRAASFYLRAAQADPTAAAPLVGLGELALDLGRPAQAESAFAAALEREPGNAAAAAGLARVLVGGNAPNKALAVLDPLHAEGRGTSGSYNVKGVALDLLGRHEAARQAYAQALARAPEDAVVLSNLALSLAVSGEFAAAADLLEEVIERPGSPAAAYENLALVYALSGEAERALAVAANVLPEATVQANRAFYEQLAGLEPTQRAEAVFLGHLPAAAAPAELPAPEETVVAAQRAEPPQSVRQAEPVGEAAAAAAEPTEPAEESAAAEPTEQSTPAAGKTEPLYHLQLAAFRSLNRVQRAWEMYRTDYPALAAYDPLVQSIEPEEGQELHRLLVGPVAGFAQASAACAAVRAEGGACVVLPRLEGARALALASPEMQSERP